MAIDTKSLTEIIPEFRALQSKDAVSPESLGYILQRIIDLLSTAGTSETVSSIQKLLDGFKAAGQAITALSQGQSDRNHIYANKSMINLATGAVATTSGIFIQQATTERSRNRCEANLGRANGRKRSSRSAFVVKRRKNRWFSRKYFASVMNIQEFYADSLGQEFCRAISNALLPSFGRFAQAKNPDIMRHAVTI